MASTLFIVCLWMGWRFRHFLETLKPFFVRQRQLFFRPLFLLNTVNSLSTSVLYIYGQHPIYCMSVNGLKVLTFSWNFETFLYKTEAAVFCPLFFPNAVNSQSASLLHIYGQHSIYCMSVNGMKVSAFSGNFETFLCKTKAAVFPSLIFSQCS